MKQLDEIIELRRDINSIIERLTELKQMTQPKVQTISDMPRGGERKNVIEEYIIKSERLQNKLNNKKLELDRKWEELKKLCENSKLTEAQLKVITNRFYFAKSWRECVLIMRTAYPDTEWNEQKLFRIYRNVLSKLNRKNK